MLKFFYTQNLEMIIVFQDWETEISLRVNEKGIEFLHSITCLSYELQFTVCIVAKLSVLLSLLVVTHLNNYDS